VPPAAPLPCPCFPPAVPCLPCSLPIPSRQGRHGSLPRLPRIGIGSPVVLHGAMNPERSQRRRLARNRQPRSCPARGDQCIGAVLWSVLVHPKSEPPRLGRIRFAFLNPQEAA
jgi:hypothetical protein